MDYEVAPWDEDPAPLIALSRAVGWEWSEARALRAQRLKPATTLLARVPGSGEVVGTVTCLLYGDAGHGSVGWVSGMIVHPEHQRRGVGRGLMDRLLAWTGEQGVSALGLEATVAGRPVYERAGFRVVAEDPRWERGEGPPVPPSAPQGPISIYPISSCEVMELAAYDTARFGARRTHLLAEPMGERPDQAFVAFDRATGKIVGHVQTQERNLGPLVADTPHAASWLLYAAEMAGAPRVAFLPGDNPEAARVFARAGYAPSGVSCARMVLGKDLPMDWTRIHALAGWGLG